MRVSTISRFDVELGQFVVRVVVGLTNDDDGVNVETFCVSRGDDLNARTNDAIARWARVETH